MSIWWFIGLSISSVIFFMTHFILSRANFKKRFGHEYDIRNHFPYEFNFESKFSDNILGNVALIMSCAISLCLFALSAAKIRTNGYVLYSLIAGSIYSLLIAIIHFVPLKTIKVHLVFSVLLLSMSFACPVAVGLGGFALYQETQKVFPLVLFIASLVIGLFYFVLVINPKLSLNIRMEVATDEKGNQIYLRPKYIVMAFSEWLNIFGIILSHILLILLMSQIL